MSVRFTLPAPPRHIKRNPFGHLSPTAVVKASSHIYQHNRRDRPFLLAADPIFQRVVVTLPPFGSVIEFSRRVLQNPDRKLRLSPVL